MRTVRVTLSLLLALAVVAAAGLGQPPAASAAKKNCGKLALAKAGATVTVRVDKGQLRCRKARRLLRRYDATTATNPSVNRGFFCFTGRRGDPYLLGCQGTPRETPVVRGYTR